MFPAELRLEIYGHLLVPDPNYFVLAYVWNQDGPRMYGRRCKDLGFQLGPSFKSFEWSREFPKPALIERPTAKIHVAILRTCNTIYNEAIEILYGGNMFGGAALASVDDRCNWPKIDLIRNIGISCFDFIKQDLALPLHVHDITIFALEPQLYLPWKPRQGEDDGAWYSRVVEGDPELHRFMARVAFLRKGGLKRVEMRGFENETLERTVQLIMQSTNFQGLRSNKYDDWSTHYVSRLPDGSMMSGIKAWQGPGTRMDGSNPLRERENSWSSSIPEHPKRL